MTAADDDDIVPLDFSEAEAEEILTDEFDSEIEPSVELDPAVVRLVRAHRVMTLNDVRHLPPVQWFIGGLVPAGERTVVHGTGGSGKTFMVLDWMLSAATGLDWHGHRVRPGRVLYIAGEGVSGIGKRIDAWCAEHDVDPNEIENIDFMPEPINLFAVEPKAVANWRAFVAFMEYDYVVIDTLHTAMSGGEENSAMTIGQVYTNATRIAGTAKLFFVHHDPKGATKGSARGSSAIRDSADVVLLVDGSASDGSAKLKADKIRDGRDFKPVVMTFTERVVGQYADGGDITTLVITGLGGQPGTKPAAVAQGYGYLPADQQQVLTFMADQAFKNATEIAKAMGKGLRTKTKFEAIKSLIETSLIYPAADGLRVRTPTTGD